MHINLYGNKCSSDGWILVCLFLFFNPFCLVVLPVIVVTQPWLLMHVAHNSFKVSHAEITVN